MDSYVGCCGHTQQVMPFPPADGSVRFVPLVDEATLMLRIIC
jgi:hypothetical protein